jgi:hypothetical protein
MRKEQVDALMARKALAQKTILEAGTSIALRAVLDLIDCIEEEGKEILVKAGPEDYLRGQGAIAALRMVRAQIVQKPPKPKPEKEAKQAQAKSGAYQ